MNTSTLLLRTLYTINNRSMKRPVAVFGLSQYAWALVVREQNSRYPTIKGCACCRGLNCAAHRAAITLVRCAQVLRSPVQAACEIYR